MLFEHVIEQLPLHHHDSAIVSAGEREELRQTVADATASDVVQRLDELPLRSSEGKTGGVIGHPRMVAEGPRVRTWPLPTLQT
jgi:hypothetical protein